MGSALKDLNAVLADVEIDLLHGIRRIDEEKMHRMGHTPEMHTYDAEVKAVQDDAELAAAEAEAEAEADEEVCPDCEGEGCEECGYTGYVDDDEEE